ncbi:HAMP domain-containing sensor histidine kinase [Rhodococcus qingshengii]|uniref:HAMP domain-containing sensor histidine kinase n=1 Tax=Rhodococcus qingshengii TaxID=334542 RepID=UPI003016A1E7
MNRKWRPPAKWRSVSQWRLGWRVVAVLALPMVVALLLGVLRVEEELAISADLGANAEYLTAVPAAFELEAALYDLAQVSASEGDPHRPGERVAAAVDTLVEGSRSLQVDGHLTTLIGQTLVQAKSILDDVLSGGVGPARLVERINETSRLLKSALDSQVVVSEHQSVRDSGSQIDAVWAARRALSDQSVFFGAGRPDSATRASIVANAGKELAALDLARSLGAISTAEADRLIASAQDRIISLGPAGLLTKLTDVQLGLQESGAAYRILMNRAATDFSAVVSNEANVSRSAALRDTALVLGSVLLALAVGLVVSRSITGPIRRLRASALHAAHDGLPEVVERIRSGEKIEDLDLASTPVHTTEELGQLARAIDDMHDQAVTLAGEQASLRQQINDMFETLSRRNRSLVEQQLNLIEELERDEDDPQRLGNLFRLDHIAARMRRNSDNLLVLAGTEGRIGRTLPILVADALRAAISGVEDYTRVELDQVPIATLKGFATADVVHVLTELLDNALRYSPPNSTVSIKAARTIDGALIIEIADHGLGIVDADIRRMNGLLSSGGTVTPDTARKMGLFVVSRLSLRHGITVRLRPTGDSARGGVTAAVLLPTALLETAPTARKQLLQNVSHLDAVAHESTVSPPTGSNLAALQPEPTRKITTMAPPSPGELPQRHPGTNSVPQEFSAGAPVVLSQPSPSASPEALPIRSPGASGSVVGVAQRAPDTASGSSRVEVDRQPPPESPHSQHESTSPRHRLDLGSITNTASFFSARGQYRTRATGAPDDAEIQSPPPILSEPGAVPPIYSRMVTEWLVDPTMVDHTRAGTPWTTAADEGWVASRISYELPPSVFTDSGLPVRDRGARLIPGTIAPQVLPDRNPLNPESIRRGLNRHHDGIRRGRDDAAEARTNARQATDPQHLKEEQ